LSRREKDRFFTAAGRQNIDEALSAVAGARYHLSHILRLQQLGFASQRQVNAFHFYMRAFFWELVSVVDCIKSTPDRPQFITDWVNVIHEQQWFREVGAYRNLAHRMFHDIQVMEPEEGGGTVFILAQALPEQSGMVSATHLMEYVKQMELALDRLTSPDTT